MAGKWFAIAGAALLAGVLAGAVSLWWGQRGETAPAEPAATPPPAEVRLEGVIGSRNVVTIPPPIPGILEMVMVEIGSEVYQGMLLAQIYNSEVEADLKAAREELRDAEDEVSSLERLRAAARLEASRAEADLARARTVFETARKAAARQAMLYREGATPRRIYEQAQAELETRRKEYDAALAIAQEAASDVEQIEKRIEAARRRVDRIRADMEAIQQDLEACQVVSPVDGVVTGMAARQGEEISAGMEALFQIAVDLSRLTVTLEPTPSEMKLLTPGQRALVYVAEMGGQPLEGRLTEMSIGKAVVDFANPSPDIRPGLTAQVVIQTAP